MAKLSFSEKKLIEIVFSMEQGYVLDFTNREFNEFMKDVVEYEIYEKYPGLSKAKMLRAFIHDESEAYVGKAIVLLINYMNDNNLTKDNIKSQSNKLYEIGRKLLGKDVKPKKVAINSSSESVNFESLKNLLIEIESLPTSQAKGFGFEKYLNKLFQAFNLKPNASYRTEHDQIDGSFVFDGNTILVEAKYKSKEIIKDDLILFENKIKAKSHFSKGLFITYSKISQKALEYFTDSGSRIVVLTVEEIFLLCQNKISLDKVIQSKYRLLDERGLIFKHFLELNLT
ncbi:MAG: restriction endonuclease [Jejuia sp.]